MKHSVRTAVLIVLGIIAVSGCGWCTTVKKEFTLPVWAGCPFRPRISGDWIVDVQNKDDKGCGSTSIGIMLYNIATGKSYMAYARSCRLVLHSRHAGCVDGKNHKYPGFLYLSKVTEAARTTHRTWSW